MAPDEIDLVVASGRLHAERWGSPSAPLVVGLPGLTGNVKSLAVLGEHLGGDALQLVALDLRGRGRSEVTPPGTYGWPAHARDVLAVADALDAERFSAVGLSMGGSVAMAVAALAGDRLDAVVLVDVAGRVDRGFAAPIAAAMGRLGEVCASPDEHVDRVRALGLVDPWTGHWDRVHRYGLRPAAGGGWTSRTDLDAVREDRAYTATQDPYARWVHLTMPTLLLRATRELAPGAGFCVPACDRDRFRRSVARAEVVEVDANHLTITAHPGAAAPAGEFLGRSLAAADRPRSGPL